VDNKCLQHVENFKYHGGETSYGKEKGIQQKLAKLSQVLGNLNNTFKAKLVVEFSRIKVCNVLPLPILVCESEFWTPRRKRIIKKRFTSFEMKYFRALFLNTN